MAALQRGCTQPLVTKVRGNFFGIVHNKSNIFLDNGRKEGSRKRGRPSLSDATDARPKVTKVGRPQTLLDHPIRYDSVGHWSAVEEQRRMCKKKGCK